MLMLMSSLGYSQPALKVIDDDTCALVPIAMIKGANILMAICDSISDELIFCQMLNKVNDSIITTLENGQVLRDSIISISEKSGRIQHQIEESLESEIVKKDKDINKLVWHRRGLLTLSIILAIFAL